MYLEIVIVDLEAHSLNDFGVFTTGQFTVLFGLGPCDDHLAATENKPSGFGIAKSHDDCSKTVGIVLGSFAFPGNFLEIQFAAEINCADDILNSGKTL